MLQLFSRRLGSRNAPAGSNAPHELKPGDRYYRTLGGRFLETVTILELRRDRVGIPHVHFSVAIEEPNVDPIDEGPRTLALSSFIEEYCRQAS